MVLGKVSGQRALEYGTPDASNSGSGLPDLWVRTAGFDSMWEIPDCPTQGVKSSFPMVIKPTVPNSKCECLNVWIGNRARFILS